MKAVILAGGRGNRINEITDSKNKCMTEVSGVPVIQYSFDNLARMNIDEAVVVVGFMAEGIINHYGNAYKNITLRYVIQKEQRGLVHAIECAKPSIEDDDFVLMLGDEVTVRSRHTQLMDEFNKGDVFAICGVLEVSDKSYIKRTYTVMHDGNKRIHRLIEKPRNPTSNIMGTGNCVFKNEILNYIDITPIHHERNEKELPDLIQCAVDDGKIVNMFNLCKSYVNINSIDDLKIANQLLSEEQNGLD